MINMTPDALLDFMRKNKYEADIQGDTQQVYTILKIDKREFPLFLRIFDQGHLLQILAFIPSHLTPNEQLTSGRNSDKHEVIADLARLLHLFNKELDVPGFGMDEMAGAIFYRLMLPTPKKKVESELLTAYLKTTEHVCKIFSTPIEALSSEQMTLNEILAKAHQMDNK